MLIKSIPQSDAQNVYDLLKDVKQAILEEPRRANMNHVATVVGTQALSWTNPRTRKALRVPAPSCGTVGCFAGWTMMLAGQTPAQALWNWTEGAQQVLGLGLNYRFEGTDGKSHSVFNWGQGDGILLIKPGTRAYARAIGRRIDRFIAANGGKAALSQRPIVRS